MAVWSCSPETQGYVIPGPNQTITPTPVHEEQNTADYMWARVNGNHDNWTREANEVTKEYDIPNHFFKGTSYYPQNGYGEEMGVCYHFRYGNIVDSTGIKAH